MGYFYLNETREQTGEQKSGHIMETIGRIQGEETSLRWGEATNNEEKHTRQWNVTKQEEPETSEQQTRDNMKLID